MSVIAILGARGQRSTNVRQKVSFTFDELVALFDPNVISYWKFQNTTGTDEKGIANATITGSPEQNIPTIVKRDTISDGAPTDGTCIAWPRTTGEYAQAAHNTAHKTASGTVVVYFQRDTSTIEKSQLIDADAVGAVGGMAIGINTNGAPDAYIRGPVGPGTPIIIPGGVGDVLIDRAYTLIFRWGSPQMSLSLWDDTGFMIRRSTNPSTIGLSGTSTIRFGATHATPVETNHHDGPYGRVIWMNRRITDNEEVVLAQANSVAHSADVYRGLELSMGPISLWGMGELAGTTIQDAVGSPPRNGTFAGVIGYNFMDIPDDSINGAINFGAGTPTTGSGTVPSTGLSIPEYSLSFWFIANTVPREGDPALPLICKGAASPIANDFSCFLASDQGDTLRVRVRDAGGVARDINTPGDTIRVGEKYHVCIRGDNTGVTLHLNGKFMGKITEQTTGWSGNTQTLQFAHGLNFAALGNCVLDEICLFNRVITVAEIAALSQRTSPPIAIADSATVLESTAANVIDVIGNDEYVGIPVIEIMPPAPVGGDSVAVVSVANTLPYIEYTAGTVGAGGATRGFSYRISDVNGISNTVTCPVTVQDSGFVATSIANCYTIPGASSQTLSGTATTMAELEDAVNTAPVGRHILIPGGTYAGGTLALNPQGTEANPIVVRPVGGRGSVIINNALWTLAATSSRLVVTNIHFNNAQINVNGSHHRIARCQFRDIGRYCVRVLAASDTRVSHCDFSVYRLNTPTDKGAVEFDCISVRDGDLQRALVDYCHIHDIRCDSDIISNTIQFAASCGSWRSKAGLTADHCLFDNIGRVGSAEFVMIKTSEVTFRYCTMINMSGLGNSPGGRNYPDSYLQQRQGSGIEIRSCWSEIPIYVFDDQNVQAPIRNPLIIGNRMVGGADLHCKAGDDAPGQGGGVRPGPYHRCTNGRFIGNMVTNGDIIIGDPTVNAGNPAFPAMNNNFVNSGPRTNSRAPGGAGGSIYDLRAQQTGTTFNDDTAADFGDAGRAATAPAVFTVGERLTTSEVGLQAPDPLCPSGPQN